jgi:RTX calcium-binding nonapeptide repeat (4 copies)
MRTIRRTVLALGLGALLVVAPAFSAGQTSADQQSAELDSPVVADSGVVGVPQAGHPFRPARPQPVELKELVWPENRVEQTTGLNIVWTNRGPGDGFDTIFGANADAARAGVDAALDGWEQVIANLNRPSAPGDNHLDITVTMNSDDPGSCGGSADGDFDGDGWPSGGDVNINGQANVWFIDPTPTESSEFTGNIDNAFSGDAQGGSPAQNLCDMETVVTAELAHILGMTSDTGSRFQFGGFNTQLTFTGTTCSGPGDLWRFTGANGTHLMTSNNGGGGGSDFGVPVHTAEPCASAGGLVGADDSGNALFEISGRYLPPNVLGLMFHDVFNMDINMPEEFGTFYSTLNKSNGNVLVRGGDDNNLSNDVINITRSGGEIAVSVDIGNDVAGTGPTDAFISHYAVGDVQSITVNALDGNDSITVEPGPGIAVTVNGGTGNDTIVGGAGPETLNGDSGNDQIFAGGGNNTVTDGTGNDLVDLTENSAPLAYTTGGGNDTVLGSSFNDTLVGSSGSDRLEGRGGNDSLTGAAGNDTLLGQEGSDTAIWNNGDGSDVIEGGSGDSDLVQANGSAGADFFQAQSAPGSKVQLDAGPFSLTIGSVEDLRINAMGSGDIITLFDLSSTELRTAALDVGSGSDTVSLYGRNAADTIETSPLGPSQVAVDGLAQEITIQPVDAGDNLTVRGEGGADTLIANATSAQESLDFNPGDADTANVFGVGPMSMTADTMEQVVVDGQGGNDTMNITSPAGAQDVSLSPGLARDAGGVAVLGLLPVQFRDLGLPGAVQLLNAGGGRADRLIYDGTPLADTFNVGAGTGVIALNSQSPVTPTGVLDLVLNGLAGDDVAMAAATLPFATMTANGGDNVGSDVLSLTSAPGAVAVDLGNRTVAGYGGTVGYTGIEALATAQNGGAGTNLTVLGTAGPDALDYVPAAGGTGGTIVRAGGAPSLSFGGVAGQLTIDPVGSVDDVEVSGTIATDSIVVRAGAVTTVQVGTTKTANIPVATSETISVFGDEGGDTVDVTVFDSVSPHLVVAGEFPSAKRFSDSLIVRNGSASHVQYRNVQSHDPGDGTIFATYRSTGNETVIDYAGIEDIKLFR